jgi:hypothetical protein
MFVLDSGIPHIKPTEEESVQAVWMHRTFCCLLCCKKNVVLVFFSYISSVIYSNSNLCKRRKNCFFITTADNGNFTGKKT